MEIAAGLPIAGVTFALSSSNLSGQVIVLILFVGSILTWSFMVVKLREIVETARASERFLSAYRAAGQPFAMSLRRGKNSDKSPVFAVYAAVSEETGKMLESCGLNPNEIFVGGAEGARSTLNARHMAAVRSVADREVAERSMLLESHMTLLASATTTAPFLGLLGTVWGVMDTFAGMSVQGSAMLSAVAPGISGALLTTVVGLLVALPSAIGYNVISERIRQLTVRTDQFAQELVSDVERFCAM